MIDEEMFLISVKSYIEQSEVEMDTHTGSHRTVAKMIDADIMPPLYAEVLERIQAPSPLVEWLEGDFKHAVTSDVMRLREALLMLRVGIDKGDTPETNLGIAIACFVRGLINKTRPLTVPVENN